MKQRTSNGVFIKPAQPVAIQEDINSLEYHVVDLAMSGKLAKVGQQAVRRQQKKGMPITYKRGKQIVKQFPDGHIEVLGGIDVPSYARPKGIRVLGRK